MKRITLFFALILCNLAWAQTLTTSVASLDFEAAQAGAQTRSMQYTLSGSGLSGDVTVTPPNGYLVSTECSKNFKTSLMFPSSQVTTGVTVYVRFAPTSAQAYTGNIVNVATGATAKNVAVTETAVASNIPANYYSNATGSGFALKSNLTGIISGHSVISYDALHTAYETTDKKPNGKVWDMYSDVGCGTAPYEFTFSTDKCGSYGKEGDCYNREHSFPASWFSDASPMYSDVFQVVPTDGKVNGMRSNYPFGQVNSASWTSLNGSKLGVNSYGSYTGVAFEPIDEFKGDFARTYFYMATRYASQIGGWTGNGQAGAILDGSGDKVFQDWYLNLMLQWHRQDPVSQKEKLRNDAAYSIQNNRNPFIDHPEYVETIWVNTIKAEPTNYVTNFTAAGKSNTEITVSWTENDGAQPADGYLVVASQNTPAVPVDGQDPADDANLSDGAAMVKVAHGSTSYTFTSAQTGVKYYFQIYSYTNSGANINFKNSGTAPAATATTSAASGTLTILSEDFTTCPSASWKIETADADNKKWACSTGTMGANSFGATPAGTASSDWLISPVMDLTQYNAEVLTFDSKTQYTGPAMKLKYSTNYTGSGNPTAATWTELPFTAATTTTFVSSGNVSLSGINSKTVYIAFHYTSTGTTAGAASAWWVDNIKVVGDYVSSVTGTSEVSAGAGAEAVTIASTTNALPNAPMNFDFTVTDDGATAATDALPSLIEQITVLAGAGNGVADFSQVLAGASLTDGTNSIDATTIGSSIIFKNLPTASGQLGYVADNATKTYQLKVWLKSDMGALQNELDGKRLAFAVNRSTFFVASQGSSGFTTGAGTNVESGTDKNEITVQATKLVFGLGKPAGNVVLSQNFGVQVLATDANGNMDKQATATVVLSRASGTGTLSAASGLEKAMTAGVASWTDVQYNTGETFTITAADKASVLTAITSGNINASATFSIIISEVADPSDNTAARFVEIYNPSNSTFDFGTQTFYLAKQANAGTVTSIKLVGTIAPKSTFVVANTKAAYNTAYNKVADMEFVDLNGNGNDGYFLYKDGDHTSGTIADALGVLNENGTGMAWEYTDKRAVRLPDIMVPNPTWTASEWKIVSATAAEMTPGVHPDQVVTPTGAKLATLTVDGNAIAGFSPNVLIYNVQVTQATPIPLVAGTTNDAGATVAVQQATNLQGAEADRTATVTVTAADNVTKTIYSVVFSVNIPTQNILVEDFTTCPSTAWKVETADIDDKKWVCDATGSMKANSFGAVPKGTASSDWLISPALNLDQYINEKLTFETKTQFKGPALTVKYSTDYTGSGNPTSATWTNLNFTAATTASTTFVPSGNVDLSAIQGGAVYLAFHYVSIGTTSDSAASWWVDNIKITGTYQSSVTGTTDISAGNAAEPATIASTINASANAAMVFDFTITDDGATSTTDNLPSLVESITIMPGANNGVADFSHVIAGAQLSDGSKTVAATIIGTDIAFKNIPVQSGELGYIADNASKTYMLQIWLKTDVGNLKGMLDGKMLAFVVNRSGIVVAAQGSSGLLSGVGNNITSGADKNKISVQATKLLFAQGKPVANVVVSQPFGVEVLATDANGNLDLDATNTVVLSRASGTGALAAASGLEKTMTAGVAKWSDVTYNTAEITTVTATEKSNALTAVTSGNINVSATFSIFMSEVADPINNANARFIELYNPSDKIFDFATETWFLAKQVNGGTTFASIQLTGTIAGRSTFVVATYDTTHTRVYGAKPNMEFKDLNGNGDDAYFLYKGGDQTTGTLIDIYGVKDQDGTGMAWEYTDKRAVRLPDIMLPNATWTATEWTITPSANTTIMTPGKHPDGKSKNDLLATLTFDGTAVTGFTPDVISYNVEVKTATPIPVVAATAAHAGATVSVTQAVNLQGTLQERTAVVTVKAEDQTTQRNYYVTFSVVTEASKALTVNEIKAFPIPCSNTLTISSNEPLTNVSLYSVTGQLLQQHKLMGNVIDINTSHLNNGLYFIKTRAASGKIATMRIVKQQ